MKNWRPDNPNKGIDYIHYASGEQLCAEREFEAGADAMLKAMAEFLKTCGGELVSRNDGPFMATFEMLAEDWEAILKEAGLDEKENSI